jgi:hypothetical protein
MFGLGVLVALGRRLVAATLADTGVLPAGYYRHLALAAFLTQLLVLRLRLLAAKHDEQRQAVQELLNQKPPETLRQRCQSLLDQENRALELLGQYEKQALEILGENREHPSRPSPKPADGD